jgi:oxygen-independent coproporphyrinogen-3 oxidase
VPYLALGPAAHGFDGEARRWNIAAYPAWRSRVLDGADPVAGSETLTAEDRTAEGVYLGLRTIDGLVVDAADEPQIAPWIAAGWARRDGERLVLAPLGWLRLDALAAALTVTRSR